MRSVAKKLELTRKTRAWRLILPVVMLRNVVIADYRRADRSQNLLKHEGSLTKYHCTGVNILISGPKSCRSELLISDQLMMIA